MRAFIVLFIVLFSNQVFSYDQKEQDFINYFKEVFFDFSYDDITRYENQNFLVLNNVNIKNNIFEGAQIKNLWVSYDYQKGLMPEKGKIVIERLWIPDNVLEIQFPYVYTQLKKENLKNTIVNFSFNYELYKDNFNLKTIIDSRDFGATQIDINLFSSKKLSNLFNRKLSKQEIKEIILEEHFRSVHFRTYNQDIFKIFVEEHMNESWQNFSSELVSLINEEKKLSIVDKSLLSGFFNQRLTKIDFTIYIQKNMKIDIKIKEFLDKIKNYKEMSFFGDGIFWAIEK